MSGSGPGIVRAKRFLGPMMVILFFLLLTNFVELSSPHLIIIFSPRNIGGTLFSLLIRSFSVYFMIHFIFAFFLI
jgi:hypothetical protein